MSDTEQKAAEKLYKEHGMYWRTGGALSGTDANDHNNGRKSAPHQTAWFVHPEHGEFDWTRWVLT